MEVPLRIKTTIATKIDRGTIFLLERSFWSSMLFLVTRNSIKITSGHGWIRMIQGKYEHQAESWQEPIDCTPGQFHVP
jgi:hypothetical protein